MASAWPTRRSQSFRGILAVCRVRACMFEWFKDGRGRQMQQDGACGEGWRVLKRQSRSQPRPCPDAPTVDDDHACHSMGTAYPYTVLCLSYTALCPVEPLSSPVCSLHFHALYTANTSCTVLLSLVVVSPTLCCRSKHATCPPVDHEVLLDHRSRAFPSC